MNFYGLISSMFFLPLFVGIWQLSNFLNHAESYWDNWGFYLGFFIIYFTIFGSFLRVDNNKVKIYRLLWIFSKRNVIQIGELKKVIINIKSGGRGGAIIFNFYGENEQHFTGFISQMFKFEIRRLKKRLNKLEVEVEVIGMDGLMI